MNIFQLQVLVAISEYGSFSDAALQLEISQSAVSRAIAALESELDVSLLTRGRFGAKLTPLGRRILDHSQKMLDLREQIEYEVNLEKGLYNGRLRIASFRSAATHLLPAKIARFQKSFPRVEVVLSELDPAGVEQSLREGQSDIGLLPLPRSDEFMTVDIARDDYVVLLPAESQELPEKLTWQDLSEKLFIVFNYAECTTAVREHWARWGQSLNVAYSIKEDSTIVSMVAQGLGAGILPRLAAMPIPDEVVIRSLPEPLERIIGAAMLAHTRPSPAASMFLDVLKEQGRFAHT
ncbi:MAG: LysR family transcriptional regulator [Cyanobacteria bacterium P01_E01_bin.6]